MPDSETRSVRLLWASAICLTLLATRPALTADAQALVQQIRQVGRQGAGTEQAQAALQRLTDMDSSVLLTILEGFDDANPVSANWLRGAFEAIADRTVRSSGTLPVDELTEFILDPGRDPGARRLAYDWLVQVDATARERLIPDMLLDPGSEFRRDAVARLMTHAESLGQNGDVEMAGEVWQKALTGAVHDDQVNRIVGALREMGQDVSVQDHFGFIANWHIIGPFDNREKKGFAVSYAPETNVDLDAEYDGQLGRITWDPISTDDDYGLVNIAETIHNHRGSCMYAFTAFASDSERVVDVRLGTPNAWKLWINGELVFQREEYHRGTRMDQYRVAAPFTAGTNTILLKVCQDERTQDWARKYQYQVRICSAAGAGILSSDAQTVTDPGTTQTSTEGED